MTIISYYIIRGLW